MNARLAALIAVTILGGLAIDHSAHAWAQPAVNAVAWAVFGLLWLRWPAADRAGLIACLLIATTGEVVLSLLWGLYDYRLGNLPLFVPPGHVLLYVLGIWLTPRVPAVCLRLIPVVAALAAAGLALDGRDLLSLPMTALFLLAIRRGPAPRLYATMFVLALLMELWGTWLGNWAWRSQVPGLGWATLNPPFAAGAFYCVLDWLVGLTVHMRSSRVKAPR